MQMCVVGVSFSGFTIHVYELVYNGILELYNRYRAKGVVKL